MSDKISKIEFEKARLDYFKHLTTLSTGSIILIATFLEKLFTNPIWKPLVVASLVGFIISVIASVLAMTLVMQYELPESPREGEDISGIGSIALLSTWTGFLIGIVGLAIFAIRNLL